MRIPVWLTLAVAALVIVFGIHRIRLSLRSDEADERAREKKGLYGMRRSTHRLVGIVYLLLGGAVVATALGWNPLGDMFGPATAPATKDTAPSKNIPIDQLPKPKS